MCLLLSLPSQSVLSAPACLGGQQPSAPRPLSPVIAQQLSCGLLDDIVSSRSEGINGSKARASPGAQLHVPGARVPQGCVPGVQGEKLPPFHLEEPKEESSRHSTHRFGAGTDLLALPRGAQNSQPLLCQRDWPRPHLQHLQRRIRFTLGHSGRSVLKLGRTGSTRYVILLGKTQQRGASEMSQWVPSPMTS